MANRLFLFGLSRIYGFVVRQRALLYNSGILKTVETKTPVISVGNITAGGNGKTPLVIYLVEELKKKGFKPVILSRGYKGSVKGPYQVLAADSPSEVGDEPKLMLELTQVPVIISRDRVAGVYLAESRRLGDVVVLDDGFQHRRLARAFDLVTINVGTDRAVEEFIAGALLPLGSFREERNEGLSRASAIILAERGYSRAPKPISQRLMATLPGHASIYQCSVIPDGVWGIKTREQLTPSQPVVAFCGLANPDPFFTTLEELGFTVQRRVFPDHHKFSEEDIKSLKDQYPGLPLICTEKDAVKIREIPSSGVYSLKIRTKVVPGDAFIVQVVRAIMAWNKRKSGALEVSSLWAEGREHSKAD